jgi:hypothetical protein
VISVASVYAWAQDSGVILPSSFIRLYEFFRQVALQPEASGVAEEIGDESSSEPPEDIEIVLGAALSLVSKMPDRCRDRNGFIDGTIVATLILDTAARWFPLSPPF